MKSAIFRLSAAALLAVGVVSAEGCVSVRHYPYRYERRDMYDRRAFDYGERDGYARGIDDVRHRRRPDIDRQRWYRRADRGYDRYEPIDVYRAEYRRGFERGYDRAYREGPRW